jgi:hypothetical protein
MFFNEDKNIAFFNKQALDTYHEIVVSFDYARYSKEDIPTGGFAVIFFNANYTKPKEGGPGLALGYLPSNNTDYCKLDGYRGVNGGVLGVGFDLNGEFGLKKYIYDGANTATPNSISIRQGIAYNWRLVTTSKNLLNTPVGVKVADRIASDNEIQYKSVKIIISNGFTKIRVQIKKAEDRNFYTVLETSIPQEERDAVRVALTSTVADDATQFDIKNFNVVGYPGVPKPPEFTDCLQNINFGEFFQGEALVSEGNFVAMPVGGKILIYKLVNNKFEQVQVLSDTNNLKLLGGSDKFLIANIENTTSIVIFYNNDNVFFRTQDFSLLEDSIATDDLTLLFDTPPVCADTDNEFLAIGNGKQVAVYFYSFNPGSAGFGIFLPTGQTLTDTISGGLGVSVQVDNDRILAGSNKGFVNSYQFDGTDFVLAQTIFDPTSGNPYSRFGAALSLQRNDLIIGAPYSYKLRYNTVGQGEAYHYFFSLNRDSGQREWKRIMNLGNFFLIDTPGGEFGASVKLRGNNLIVGAPTENYLTPPEQPFENMPNAGRVYLFEKTRSGLFTNGAKIAPDADQVTPYSFYGKYVGFYGDNVGISITPYTPGGKPSEVNFINKNCVFEEPPKHLPITFQSIALVDNAGYMIDIETLTYMQLLCTYRAYEKKDEGFIL